MVSAVKITDPGMVQVRSYEDVETDQIMYQFSITFQTTIAIDLNAVECNGNKARDVAMSAGIELLEKEIARNVSED